jgi:hypothetical protein
MRLPSVSPLVANVVAEGEMTYPSFFSNPCNICSFAYGRALLLLADVRNVAGVTSSSSTPASFNLGLHPHTLTQTQMNVRQRYVLQNLAAFFTPFDCL